MMKPINRENSAGKINFSMDCVAIEKVLSWMQVYKQCVNATLKIFSTGIPIILCTYTTCKIYSVEHSHLWKLFLSHFSCAYIFMLVSTECWPWYITMSLLRSRQV